MEEEQDFSSLTIEARCSHKSWKARLSGYEAANKIFNQWDSDDPNWKKYAGLIKSFVTDSNVITLDKGLVAALTFMENSNCASRIVSDVIEGIVTKCLGATKASIKDNSLKMVLMCCEIEVVDKCVEELIKGLSQKNPKIVASCLHCLTECVRTFGAKVVRVSPLIKASLSLFDHRDVIVREECKGLAVEAYRWVGGLMKSQLTGLKPVQLKELEAGFSKYDDCKAPVPLRFLRSQQKISHHLATNEDDQCTGDDENNEVDLVEADPYEMLDPVNILAVIPKDFFVAIEDKKWQIRKEALDGMLPLCKTPKIAAGDFGELVRTLQKVVNKDSNIIIVTIAIQCLSGLALGMRLAFKTYATRILVDLLEKFKEKKATVVAAVTEAVDSLYPILGIEAIQEDTLQCLKHKTPSVNSETAKYLARCFSKCPEPLFTNKKMLRGFVLALQEKLEVADPAVRDAAYEALGTLFALLREEVIIKILPDIDKSKLAKIKEHASKVVLVGAKKPKSAVGSNSKSAKVVKPSPSVSSSMTVTSSNSNTNSIKKLTGTRKCPKSVASNTSSAASYFTVPVEFDLSMEECIEKASDILPIGAIQNLADSDWKTRLNAAEDIFAILNSFSHTSSNTFSTLALVKVFCCQKPGLKDNNFQVLNKRLYLLHILSRCGTWTQQCCDAITPDIVEKLGDSKNNAIVKETLYNLAERFSFYFISNLVLEQGMTSKNPKVKSEVFGWTAEGLKAFGTMGFKPASVLDAIQKGIADSNKMVRVSSIQLAAILIWMIGPSSRSMFEKNKSSLLEQIDAAGTELSNEPVPSPCRGPNVGKVLIPGDTEKDQTAQMDVLPRIDISSKITENLLCRLSDKDWKVRKEGMDELKKIMSSKRISPNVGCGLNEALCARFTDSNKVISILAVEVVQNMAEAMGPLIKSHLASLLPGLLNALTDGKATFRGSIIACLDTILEQTTITNFFINEIFVSALNKGNPFSKQEIFLWLSRTLMEAPLSVSKDELLACLPVIFSSIEDRNLDVRKTSKDVIPAFMRHIGYQKMRRACDKIKPASKSMIIPILDKVRESLPAASLPPNKESSHPVSRSVKIRPVSAVSNSAKAKEEKDDGGLDGGATPPYVASNLKVVRFKDEVKMKVLKWNFTTAPRPEYISQLQDQIITANFSKTITNQLFHTDFKQHIKAIDTLSRFVDVDLEGLTANLDLILKLMTLKFFETNPAVLLKALAYLNSLFQVLSNNEYCLCDIEAVSFIPILLTRIGDPKDQVRNGVRQIVQLLSQIYPAGKISLHLMEALKSKNAKQRSESLEVISKLISTNGINCLLPNTTQYVKEIARHIGDRDTIVRNAALNTLTEIFFQSGDKIFKWIGNLPEKELSMLEERIKRSTMNKPEKDQQQQETPLPPVSAAESSNSTFGYTRAVSGTFSLDVDKFDFNNENDTHHGDDEDNDDNKSPKLIKHDLSGIFDEKPLTLPPSVRVNTKLLSSVQSSTDVDIDELLCQLRDTSNSTSRIRDVIFQISKMISETKHHALIAVHVNQLLIACHTQYRHIMSQNVEGDRHSAEELLSFLTMLLTNLYRYEKITQNVHTEPLYDIILVVISLVLDERTFQAKNSDNVIRTLNILAVKIVERSNHTAVVSALIKLLKNFVANSTVNPKFVELIMKCIWKAIQLFSQWIGNSPHDLKIEEVLQEVEYFFDQHPMSYWKQQASDTPIRTIKTVVHAILKIKGEEIRPYLKFVSLKEGSEMVAYIERHLSSFPSQTHDHDALAKIFKLIGQKDTSMQGLRQLHAYKLKHPNANLEPFLANATTPTFREFITRGLLQVEQESMSPVKTPAPVNVATEVKSDFVASYLERLKILRTQCGLNNDRLEDLENNTSNEQCENYNPMENRPSYNGVSNNKVSLTNTDRLARSKDLEEMKKRLERVKKAATNMAL